MIPPRREGARRALPAFLLLLASIGCTHKAKKTLPQAAQPSPLVGLWHSVTDSSSMLLGVDGRAHITGPGIPKMDITWRGEPAGAAPESLCLTMQQQTRCTPLEFRGDSMVLDNPSGAQMFARTR